MTDTPALDEVTRRGWRVVWRQEDDLHGSMHWLEVRDTQGNELARSTGIRVWPKWSEEERASVDMWVP